jgi:putative colanic acid biosynthesis glycosyltransferase
MNKGASRAAGDWLHFLNAGDSFANPESLETMVAALAGCDRTSVWAVSGALNLGGSSRAASPIRNLPHRWWPHTWGWQPHCHQACWFTRRSFELVGGYDLQTGFVADFDLIMRVGLLGRPLEVPAMLIHYAGGGMSEQRRNEIPILLHEARVRRFGYGPSARKLDVVVTRALALIMRSRIRVGGVRRRIGARGAVLPG